MSAPVRMEQLGYHWTDFHEICVFEDIWKNMLK